MEGSLTTTVTETQEGRERHQYIFYSIILLTRHGVSVSRGHLGFSFYLLLFFFSCFFLFFKLFKPHLLNLTRSIITGFRFVHHLIRLEAFPFPIFSLSDALVMVIFQLKTIKFGSLFFVVKKLYILVTDNLIFIIVFYLFYLYI